MSPTVSKLDFVLSLIDRVSQPLSKVKTGFSDMATQGQKSIKEMGVGVAGLLGSAFALKTAMAPALGQNAALGEVESLGVAVDALELLTSARCNSQSLMVKARLALSLRPTTSKAQLLA